MSGLAKMVSGSILGRIKLGLYDSESDVADEYDSTIAALAGFKEAALIAYRKSQSCTHLYGKTTHTVRRMMFGYNTVYERSCLRCDHVDYVTTADGNKQGRELPSWTIESSECYYNNDI